LSEKEGTYRIRKAAATVGGKNYWQLADINKKDRRDGPDHYDDHDQEIDGKVERPTK